MAEDAAQCKSPSLVPNDGEKKHDLMETMLRVDYGMELEAKAGSVDQVERHFYYTDSDGSCNSK